MARRGSLELWDYVATGVGMALACSSYAMLAELFQLVRRGQLLLAIGAGGLLCILVASAVGELAGMYPSAPGIRTYLRGAFGDRVSLTLTFVVFAIVMLFAGVETYFFAITLKRVVTGVPDALAVTLPIGLVVVTNLFGAELPRVAQITMTSLLVTALIAVAIAALLVPGVPAAAAAVPGGDGLALAGAVGAAIFLYTGFEWVTPLGRRPASYRRLIPLSMPIALLILVGMFCALAAAMERVFPALGLPRYGDAPHVDVGRGVGGRWGELAMVGVSLLSMLTTFNAGLMGASRLVYAVGRERLLPRWSTRLLVSTSAPLGGVLFIGVGACLVALLELHLRIHVTVALVCAALYTVVYGAFLAACVRLRRLQPGVERPFRSPAPALLLWVCAGILPLLGVATLLSDPAHSRNASAGFVLVLGLCAAAATRSQTRWRSK